MSATKWIELEEYVPRDLVREQMETSVGESLWRRFGTQVGVDFPTPKTNDQWRLVCQGWVGFIPLTRDLGFHLVSKMPLSNLFRMLEYAYNLKSLHFLDGTAQCDTLEDFYSRLASVLASRVLDRERRGLYRSYRDQREGVLYLRGRVDIRRHVTKPWSTNFDCEFQEHLADIEDNQILAWTLHLITRSQLCSEDTVGTCRLAYRKIRTCVGLQPFRGIDCARRVYNRLNQDYEPLHSLCRFFLDQCGPSTLVGEYAMLPFLIDMASLFELFLANWLAAHLPPQFAVRRQEQVVVGTSEEMLFKMDLVLYDVASGTVKCILDTKYKVSDTPSAQDVEQMIAYAVVRSCSQAVLVYPSSHIKPFDARVQDIRVRSIAFRIDEGNLEESGQEFLAELLSWVKE